MTTQVPSQVAPSRIAVVTGASSGIGRMTAIALAGAGWNVVLSARREPELAETAKLCAEARGENVAASGKVAFVATGDVTKEEDVKRLFESAVAEYGEYPIIDTRLSLTFGAGKIDLLFNVRIPMQSMNIKTDFL